MLVDDSRARSPSIGTGSVRRIAQLTRLFPGARFTPIRGNLDTRLRKLDEGEHDALVLAAAGLRRLGFASRISFALPADGVRAGAGTGNRGRSKSATTTSEVRRAGRARSTIAIAGAALDAERALVEALGGGCQTPIGALAHVDARSRSRVATASRAECAAVVVSLDGSRASCARDRRRASAR